MGKLDTRERILNAAEGLYATKGLAATTNNDVLARSKQRNQSALHYHFGSQRGLVGAILARHQDRIEARRWDLLTDLDALETPPLSDIVAALVVPAADSLRTASGRNYLLVVPQVAHRRDLRGSDVLSSGSLVEALDRIEAHLTGLDHLDADERRARIESIGVIVGELLADRSRRLRRRSGSQPLDHDRFVDNLVSMITGALEAGGARAK